ncbi:MAG TPA: hypothetical protein DCW90_09090 [Lachnospiraceae bacterium]|nr:hypothetical protein [Lachnospiraceae bacterium]
MKKLFISCPMKDKSNAEIIETRNTILERVKLATGEDDLELIDSFFQGAPHDATPLWFLGKSLELLSTADIVAFGPDWDKYRGCKMEHECAKKYGFKILLPEDYYPHCCG